MMLANIITQQTDTLQQQQQQHLLNKVYIHRKSFGLLSCNMRAKQQDLCVGRKEQFAFERASQKITDREWDCENEEEEKKVFFFEEPENKSSD